MNGDFGRLTDWTSHSPLMTMGWSRRKIRTQMKLIFCVKRSHAQWRVLGLHTLNLLAIEALYIPWLLPFQRLQYSDISEVCVTVLLPPLVMDLNITEHFAGRSSSFGSFLINYVYLGYMAFGSQSTFGLLSISSKSKY